MPNQREEPVKPETIDNDAGGPVKTFLEHLEDLRWTLIKSVTVILLAMLVCMIAGNRLVSILTWPLEHSRGVARPDDNVPVLLGTNVLGQLSRATLGLPTNSVGQLNALKLLPMIEGTNVLLVLVPDSGPPQMNMRRSPVLKNYTPLGGIIVALKLAIYGGLILASPFVLYFIGQFVLPALKVKEKRILFRAVAFGTVLFFLGVVFCYFVVAGFTLMATVQFSEWMGFAADEWRAEDYITFMCRFMLGMGLGFELPVVILTLVKIGLLDYERLVRYRAYAIVGNLIIAAFATPSGDPFTMFMMALPMQFLYEISVWIAWYWQRRDRKRELAGQKV